MSDLTISLSPREAMTILRRTGTFDWSLVGLDTPPSSLSECLAWQPEDMARIAEGFEGTSRRIVQGVEPADEPAIDPGSLLSAPWVSAADSGLQVCKKVQERSGETPGVLSDLCRRDSSLRTIAHYGGRAKDGAMDVRLCLSAFGWWMVRDVVDGLRETTAAMPRAEAERFLAPFSPMLVLLGQIMEEKGARRDKTVAAVEQMSAEVQAAAEERDEAEAALKLRGEPPVPRDTLLSMARKQEAAPQAAPRRKSRR